MNATYLDLWDFYWIKLPLMFIKFDAKRYMFNFCRDVCSISNKIQSGFDGFHWTTWFPLLQPIFPEEKKSVLAAMKFAPQFLGVKIGPLTSGEANSNPPNPDPNLP